MWFDEHSTLVSDMLNPELQFQMDFVGGHYVCTAVSAIWARGEMKNADGTAEVRSGVIIEAEI